MPEIQINLTKRQSTAWRLLTNSEDIDLCYGGGKGGGKSFLFCLWVDHWMEWLVEYFGLIKGSQPKNPVPLGFIGRKQGIDFKHTTLETFKRVIPPDHYRIKEQDQEIIFWDVAKVLYGGLDDKQRINKFNSAENAFIALDQAEETERTDVSVLQASCRLKINGKQPPYKKLYTANPADCWLKEDFIDNKLPGKHFVPALYSDNPHLPDNYADTLTSSFRYNVALLEAYLRGNWYALQASNALLSSKMFDDLKNIVRHRKDIRRVVVCDPSLGGDECVIRLMENYKTLEMKIMHERDPMKIAGEMLVIGQRGRCPNFAADVTGGLGEAILYRVKEMAPNSRQIHINYSAREDYFDHGVNMRAEMAWHYMEKVIDRELPFPEDELTRKQLLAIRFKVVNSNGHIILEDKAIHKKRVGSSPDRADCEIMGVWATDQTEPVMADDVWRTQRSSGAIESVTTSAMTA